MKNRISALTRWPAGYDERAQRRERDLAFVDAIEGIWLREGTHAEYQAVFHDLTPIFESVSKYGYLLQ